MSKIERPKPTLEELNDGRERLVSIKQITTDPVLLDNLNKEIRLIDFLIEDLLTRSNEGIAPVM